MTIVDISAAMVIITVLWLILPQYDKAAAEPSQSQDLDRPSLRTRRADSRPLDLRGRVAGALAAAAGVGAGGARAPGAPAGGHSVSRSGGTSESSSGGSAGIVPLPRPHSRARR